MRAINNRYKENKQGTSYGSLTPRKKKRIEEGNGGKGGNGGNGGGGGRGGNGEEGDGGDGKGEEE